MSQDFRNLGYQPKDAKAQRIFYAMHDTIVVPVVTGETFGILTDTQQLFTGNKHRILQSKEKFPLPQGKAFQIQHIRIDTNIVLEREQDQATFERFSTLSINRHDVEYSDLQIGMFMNYSRVTNGTIATDTATPALVTRNTNEILKRDGYAYPVIKPITISESQVPEIEFKVGGKEWKTGPIATHGTKFGPNVYDSVNSNVMYIRIALIGELVRRVSA